MIFIIFYILFIRRLLLSLGVLFLSSSAQGAIQTFEDGTYSQTFHVENRVRRMINQLMYFLDMDVNECAYNCMIHVRCETFNYNFDQKICELVGGEFSKDIAYKARGWSNFRPSPKGKNVIPHSRKFYRQFYSILEEGKKKLR